MKKILFAGVASLLAFFVGLAGMYYAIPAVAPQRAEEARAMLDSLAIVDSLALADSLAVLERFALRDSLRRAVTEDGDTLALAMLDSLSLAIGDSLATDDSTAVLPTTPKDTITALQDSLTVYRSYAEGLHANNEDLHRRIQTLEQELGLQRIQTEEIQKLSTTLSKLEGRELSSIVEKLDMDVLTMLYDGMSDRNRTRLLQAMPAPMVAELIRHLIQPANTSAATTSLRSDTLAAASETNSPPPLDNE